LRHHSAPRREVTRDAALYITKLPKAQPCPGLAGCDGRVDLVAERDGPKMFARIGMMRALNRRVERVFDISRKETHWGKRKLARDR
jgi:hypothetical protein